MSGRLPVNSCPCRTVRSKQPLILLSDSTPARKACPLLTLSCWFQTKNAMIYSLDREKKGMACLNRITSFRNAHWLQSVNIRISLFIKHSISPTTLLLARCFVGHLYNPHRCNSIMLKWTQRARPSGERKKTHRIKQILSKNYWVEKCYAFSYGRGLNSCTTPARRRWPVPAVWIRTGTLGLSVRAGPKPAHPSLCHLSSMCARLRQL